jgi:aryl-alcohol dehydrogenase-like predicted oxidoreductase
VGRGHGTGVIVYSPMQSGLLTDTFSVERLAAMADDDWRRRSTQFTEPHLSRNIALRDALRPIANVTASRCRPSRSRGPSRAPA